MRTQWRWLLLGLAACGGAPSLGATTSGSREVRAHTVEHDRGGARFSVRVNTEEAAAYVLHFAQGTSMRAHPSGGVVVVGCSEGPTDLRRGIAEGESLAFVARVDPASGDIAWVRSVRVGAGAFANNCRVHTEVGRARSMTRAQIAVDDEGRTLLALRASATDAAVLGTRGSVAEGPAVLAFDPDGALLWSRTLGAAEGADGIAGMALHPEGGVDVVVRRAREDGLDRHELIHLDREGEPSERGVLEATSASGGVCQPGGCGVSVEWVNRDRDGSLVVYGRAWGVALSPSDDAATRADPLVASTFWLAFDPGGRLRWLRDAEASYTSLMDAGDHGVLATQRSSSGEERAVLVRPEHGEFRSAMRDDLAGDAHLALQFVERQLSALPEASLAYSSEQRSLQWTLFGVQLAPDDVAAIAAFAPHGDATQGLRLADGSLVRWETVFGTLTLGSVTLAAKPRMVECGVGPVGEEESIPDGCLQPYDTPAVALLYWPPRERDPTDRSSSGSTASGPARTKNSRR